MRYVSTRGAAPPVSFSQAAATGLGPDGGLYVPERFPVADLREHPADAEFAGTAARVLVPFFQGDPLEAELPAICTAALSFPIPLVPLAPRGTATGGLAVLELYWGPTAAFKDVGARFLGECLARAGRGGPECTVLVATSGDTGSAVAAAFHRRPGFEVVVLFPDGGVSDRQRHQLCCFGDNVHAFAVCGSFDDCQRLLKAAMHDPGFCGQRTLTTANSINIGRLLPQVTYYAEAGLRYARAHGAVPDFVVPSGNVGNATAALWAKRIGFPVGRVVLATNANRPVPDYLATGRWRPRPSVRTLANAMDVGDPSNMERVRHLYPDVDALRFHVEAVAVGDAEIERTIRDGVARFGRVWDPHTATAVHVARLRRAPHQIVVSTAHPAKFDGIVEPLVGAPVEVPPALAALLARPARCATIENDLAALDVALGRASG